MSYDGPERTAAPDTIVPDTKNWTWVLERPCPQCGLDTRAVEPLEIARMGVQTYDITHYQPILFCAEGFAEVLRGSDVRVRPEPAVWSPLEYGCHVRDVFRVFGERIRLMLAEDDPLFENWDQDEAAALGGYGSRDPQQVGVDLATEQDPAAVAAELRAAAAATTARLDGVSGEQWQRPGRRTDGSVFTVASLSRYLLHDPVHHLYDVTGVRSA